MPKGRRKFAGRTVSVTVNLPASTAEPLRTYATANGLFFADVVRAACDWYLKQAAERSGVRKVEQSLSEGVAS